jgi:hypothetical protein
MFGKLRVLMKKWMGNHGKGCCKLNYDIRNHLECALEKFDMCSHCWNLS